MIADLTDYTRALQVHADLSRENKEIDSHRLFVPHYPPKKSPLSTKTLCSEAMRKDGMPLKGTYSWSSLRVGPTPVLRRHPFWGEVYDVMKAPLVVEEAFKHQDWRDAYRTLTPEKDAPNLGTLRKAWVVNPHNHHDLATRRKPWSERVQGFLQVKERARKRYAENKAARRAACPVIALSS